MTIRHHVSDALLLDYATGSLEESWSLALATHLSLCPQCRQRLTAMEATGGAMLETLSETRSDAGRDDASWAAVRARLAETPAIPDMPQEDPADTAVFPAPLRRYVGGDIDTLKWKPLGLGAYHYPIPTGDKSISARLLRIPAGQPVPEHTHGGKELTVVLRGSFQDEAGRFGRGDFEETDDTVMHQPVADPGTDCICLAVTDAPLRFKSRLMRFIQPLIGI